jgi:hypothetical protein
MSSITLEYFARTDRWTLKMAFSTLNATSDARVIRMVDVKDPDLKNEVAILQIEAVMMARYSGGIVMNGCLRS